MNRAEKDAAALNAVAAEQASREDSRRERSIRVWGHPGAWCKPYPMTVEEIALIAVRAAEPESHDEVERPRRNRWKLQVCPACGDHVIAEGVVPASEVERLREAAQKFFVVLDKEVNAGDWRPWSKQLAAAQADLRAALAATQGEGE